MTCYIVMSKHIGKLLPMFYEIEKSHPQKSEKFTEIEGIKLVIKNLTGYQKSNKSYKVDIQFVFIISWTEKST